MKIFKISKHEKSEKEVISPDLLIAYVDSLKLYLKDNPNINNDYKKLINNLPASTKISKDFSKSECELLYETVGYLWEKLTGKDIIEENKITNSLEKLNGSYWLIKSGVILSGPNHKTIARQQMQLMCSLLNIHTMAMLQNLSSHPNKVIHLIIKNGGVRMFVDKNGEAHFQMTDKTYGEWGKKKVKKLDLKKKIVKVIDPKSPYEGWKSGITILL